MKLPSLALFLCLASCASSKAIVAPGNAVADSGFDGFPAQSLEGIVYAQASFDADYEETFHVDLIDRGILPIHVNMQLRGEGQENAQILVRPGRMGARLYLLDGTVLEHVPADQITPSLKEKAAREVRRLAFQGGLLGSYAREGYLYFALVPEEDFDANGRSLVHTVDGIARSLDVTHSLFAFDVMVEDQATPFYVGIQR